MPRIKQSVKRPWIPDKVSVNHRGNDPFYKSYAWVKDRKARRSHDPMNKFCAECLKDGRYVLGPIEDHIKPMNQGGDPWSWDNRQSLCRHHHAIKSAKEKGGGVL